MRRTIVALAVLACIPQGIGGVRQKDVFFDDFLKDLSKKPPGRWEAVRGNPWKVSKGRLAKAPAKAEYETAMTVCDFPMTEGTVEALVLPAAKRSASVGLVAKYISPDKCIYVRIAYWHAAVHFGRPSDALMIGPFSLWDIHDQSQIRGPVKLKFEMRDGRVGLYINDVLRTVFADPYAGQAGRPGLYTESTTYAEWFKARRTK